MDGFRSAFVRGYSLRPLMTIGRRATARIEANSVARIGFGPS